MNLAPINPMPESYFVSCFSDLRGVRWRISLGILPSSPSSIDDLRRVTADSRRRYAGLRRHLLLDPQVQKDGNRSPDLVIDNPLSQNPDSMWSRYFQNAELEKMVDQHLSRLYPEHGIGSYFQTPGCQGILRRILLLWCLRYPEYGYRQGMHELLAPLVYVLHSDLQLLCDVRSNYEDYFTDKFDDAFFHESDLSYNFDFARTPDSIDSAVGFQEEAKKLINRQELDPNIQMIISLSDAYGPEGELGIVLSEKFLEHDAYCMFDALMRGAGGAVAMAEFFAHSPASASQTGLPPVIEASSALYHLLSIADSSLHSHLVELGVEPQYFTLRWLRVLFGREFSLEHLLLIWDGIFSFDNSQSVQATEHELGSHSGVLNSCRGAFILAMAVSMILNMRSSLLATENATCCLQRLLNFPENVDLEKLIGKATSLLSVAVDDNNSQFPFPSDLPYYGHGTPNGARGHSRSLSFDSSSPKTQNSSFPERYWEEKWRVIHEEEELKKESSGKQGSMTPKRSWTQKVKMKLSRTESDPSSKREKRERDNKSSVRRSLLEDLAQELQLDKDDEEAKDSESVSGEDPLLAASDTREEVQDDPVHVENGNLGCQSTHSEENSPSFSDPGRPGVSNSLENGSEESNFASNVCQEVNDCAPQSVDTGPSVGVESPPPVSDPPGTGTFLSGCGSSTESCVSEPCSMDSKAPNSVSGKFQWLWKITRQATGGAGSHEKNRIMDSAEERNVEEDCDGQILISTLRNLGQSMLEKIQVIETVFKDDRGRVGSLENISKNPWVGKGQVTAMAALKELQWISNVLSEM